MRTTIFALIAALFISTSVSTAHAAFNAGVRSAITETKATVDDFTQLQIKDRLRRVIGAIVNRGAEALNEAGHGQQANQMLREWKVIETQIFQRTGYLGEHRPLSEWLAKTYKTMEILLGKSRMQQLHLDDIYVINFAIPVVLAPSAGWGKFEYGAHFVPLASVVTFWSSFGACMYAFGGRSGAYPYCNRIGMVLKGGVTGEVGPLLSNFVFEKFNNRNFRGQLNITADQIARRYGAELSQVQF